MIESEARDLFVRQFGGQPEVRLPFGRVDVVIDDLAVEVEPVERYREGVRQAMAYSAMTRPRARSMRRKLNVYLKYPAVALYGVIPRGRARALFLELHPWVTVFLLDGTTWVYVLTEDDAASRDWRALTTTSAVQRPITASYAG